MPALTTDHLLSDLQKLRLISSATRARIEAACGEDKSPRELGRVLAKLGGLTSFQIEMVLMGRADKLIFGPYLLINRLAEGGMGTVYEARHSRIGRTVALKVIRHDKLRSKVVAKRFLREIRLTARLEHPQLIRAYDAGVLGDQIYLATEFIRGRDLGTYVREKGPMRPDEACAVIYQAALALQHIHENGMVHRDIKPSNLIRSDADGGIKLLDLGLCGVPHDGASFDSHTGTITRDGVLLGTPDYIAPEQAQDPHHADIRADLYSLGCTFYYLLTGRPPFVGGSAVDKLMRHLYESPPQVQLPNGEASPAILDIISGLMSKQPEDRYTTPQMLADMLQAVRTHGAAPDPFEQLLTTETTIPHVKSPLPQTPIKSREWFVWAGSLATLLISVVLIAMKLSRH